MSEIEFIPLNLRKCVKRCYNLEEAEAFKIQCIINGDTVVQQESNFSKWGEFYIDIYYYKGNHKRKRNFMTVKEAIINNKIEDFDIHFSNVLDAPIKNPNPNTVAELTVKSISIDYIRQTAEISVVAT